MRALDAACMRICMRLQSNGVSSRVAELGIKESVNTIRGMNQHFFY